MIEKKRRLSRYKNDPQKLAKYLTSQGFSWQDVKDQLLAEREDT
jgi:SOS response regulatory protein OraA/RecX